MASNSKLYRSFIILQEDERGYTNSVDKTLSGYSKIEARGDKCKIAFYAQNLKRDEADNYHMVLICCKRECKQLIDLGSITINDSGKGEMTKEFNSSDIGGLGIPFDKVSGAAIVKMREDVCIYVMCGFLQGEETKENWKNYPIMKILDVKERHNEKSNKSNLKKDSKKHENRNIEIKPKEIKEVLEAVQIEEVEEIKIEQPIAEEVRSSDKIEHNEKVCEEAGGKEYIKIKIEATGEEVYAPKNNVRGKFDDYESSIETKSDFDPNTTRISGSIGEYFEGIAEGFENLKNKFKDIKYTKWYKVPVKDINQMCNSSNYNKYTLAYYPMINYYPYIRKHGCFVMGYKCDENGNLKYIVYGVYGKKDKIDQPYDGKTGFVTWVKDENNEDMGCWLMFYDFKTSTVVVPMQ